MGANLQEPYQIVGRVTCDIEGPGGTDPQVIALFNSVEWEEHFPASGFRFERATSTPNLIVHSMGMFEWDSRDLEFEGEASWDIDDSQAEPGKPTDEELMAFLEAWNDTWGQAICYFSHEKFPGISFVGYFEEGPESSGPVRKTDT